MSNKKFLFFYLNTGAGHISAAKVLAAAMKEQDPDIEVKMLNGFCSRKLGHFIFEKGYNYSKIDGIKVLYDDGFALVRKSNTGPNITTRYESSNKEKLELIKKEFDSLIIKYSKE